MSQTDSHLSFEQQQKRAKDLLRDQRAGNVHAAARIARHLPRAQELSVDAIIGSRFTLAEAQLIIAREAGFASWPKMKRFIEKSAGTVIDPADAWITAAFAGNDAAVAEILQDDPFITKRSIYAATVVADAAAVFEFLQADKSLADRRGGRRKWTPLLYLCCSRYARADREKMAARLEIAERLIALGADPNAKGLEPGFTANSVTRIFDDDHWLPLDGAAGRLASTELVRLLVASGATPLKTSALLSQAVRGGNIDVLRLLLALVPRDWYQVIWALQAAVVLKKRDMAELLARHAASPSMLKPGLIEAIRLQRDASFVEVILGQDSSELSHPVRTIALREAVRHGQFETAELLVRQGADQSGTGVIDRVIGACMAGDHDEVRRLIESATENSPRPLHENDHRMLSWAIRNNRHAAVPLLLQIGLAPKIPDKDGETPLHLAVRFTRFETIDALLAAGADPRALNFDSKTPLDIALDLSDVSQRDQITRRLLDAGARPAVSPHVEDAEQDLLFERAADAVAFGELEELREMLDEQPSLVHARSPRPHRCTLLNYCGANGTEDPRQRTPHNAPEIARLLLERGADPNATCKLYGGGATTMGLMLTSMHPKQAGKDAELVRVLARFGAKLEADDLMCAIEYGSTGAVQAFVEAGAAIDNLFIAAGTGRLEVVEKLVADAVDINSRYRGQGTALHAAAGMDKKDAVVFLLEHGADKTLHNVWGSTPADSASFFGHPELADFIRNYERRRRDR